MVELFLQDSCTVAQALILTQPFPPTHPICHALFLRRHLPHQIISPFSPPHPSPSQLDEMLEEDGRGDDDEDALVAYRQKRRNEMLEKQRGTRFGGLRHITKPQYVDEVTNAGEGIWVLCLLMEEGHDACDKLRRIMEEVADRHPSLKIVTIKSTDAIDRFPPSLLPTALVYQSGSMQRQINGLQAFGPGNGANASLEATETLLRKLGPLRGMRQDSESEDEDEEEGEARTAGTMRSCGGRTSKFSLMN